MMNTLLLTALLLVANPHNGQSSKLSVLDSDTIESLQNGEAWITIHPNGAPVAFEFHKDMPTESAFVTEMIENLPESDTSHAPQSIQIEISGDCPSKTYTILGMLPYSGKMGAGSPRTDLKTGPENVLKRVQTGSPIQQVFDVVCQ
jgi:hypothetical protein